MRHLTLSEVTTDDVRAMLTENETLFVEHKTALREDAYQIAKAVTSFANTLGGWVLVGVTDRTPNAGCRDGWHPVAASQMTDLVREALATNKVDPIPPFAATVIDYGEHAQPIGLIRVYESADTPHIMGNGHIFVRSVAQDRKQAVVYRPGGIDTQAALRALVDRGERAEHRSKIKLHPDETPLAAQAMGIALSSMITTAPGAIALRAIPLTTGRFTDWAVSARARDALSHAVRVLARSDLTGEVKTHPHASGLVADIGTNGPIEPLPGLVPRDWMATAVADCAGVLGVSLRFPQRHPPSEKTTLTLANFRDALIRPLLDTMTTALHAAEAFGRIRLELRIGSLGDTIRLADDGRHERALPGNLPLGGELSLPVVEPADEQVAMLAEQWRADLGRAAGYMELRP